MNPIEYDTETFVIHEIFNELFNIKKKKFIHYVISMEMFLLLLRAKWNKLCGSFHFGFFLRLKMMVVVFVGWLVS